EEEQRGAHGETDRERRASLLAARQRATVAIRELGQAHPLEDPVDDLIGRWIPPAARKQLDVFAHARLEEHALRVLRQVRRAFGEAPRALGACGLSLQQNVAGPRHVDPRERAHEGLLAGTVSAE